MPTSGQTEEHHEQLNQQRRAADDPDVKARDLLKHADIGKLNQRHVTIAMTMPSENEITVSGMVVVRPGRSIWPNESINS